MEDYQYEMINIFNNNFICNNVGKILKLYKKDISILEYFEKINLKEEKYMHPLFKNYNYCIFCREKAKTKYYSQNLINTHSDLEEKTIGIYLLKNKIKLRDIRNKKEKIAKRRFINSSEKIDLSQKNNKTLIPDSESDTELYIENNNNKNKNYDKYISKNINKGNNKIIKETNYKRIKSFKKELSKEYKDKKSKKSKMNDYNNSKIENISPRGKKDLINKSTERKINIDDYDNIEKQIKLDNNKLNVDDQDEIKTNINIEDQYIDKNNFIIDINNNNEFTRKKSKDSSKYSKKKQNNNPNILIESSNINSEIKLDSDNKEKNKIDKIELINVSRDEEEDKVSNKSNKSNKLLEVFNETKKFLGFGRTNTQLNKRRSLSKEVENNILGRNQSIKTKESKLKAKNLKNFSEKNDNCSICLQEIKEKFTLICGDFFCRDCMRSTILTAIKEISNLDKLHCPTCNEHIEENTIKKLLTEEEFQKYQTLMTKIEGLKNHKDYIPCPYPDCPGWVDKNQFNDNNIIYCQYEHTFCKKCLNIVDNTFRQNNMHKCFDHNTAEENQMIKFLKENKNYRKCPNCQSLVVREAGGCNNMTCTNVWCGYEFCWICNRKYEDSHYRNPISMCFGLSEMNIDGKLAKYSRVRFFRCLLIFMLIIFVILPVIIVFFSVFEVCLYIISFVLDGSGMKNIKLKSLYAHKFFYKVVYAFYISIGIAFIPIGYMSLAVFSVLLPAVCIYSKIKKNNEEELE